MSLISTGISSFAVLFSWVCNVAGFTHLHVQTTNRAFCLCGIVELTSWCALLISYKTVVGLFIIIVISISIITVVVTQWIGVRSEPRHLFC